MANRTGMGQVTITGTAKQIVPANQERVQLTITKVGTAPNDVYLGCDSSVTTSSGHVLAGACGQSITIPTTGAIFGITVGGSQVVSFLETTQ